MARKIVRGLLIASCILALLMVALWIWVEETPDPLTACYGSKEYDIGRLEIAPFSQGQSNDPVRVIHDQVLIERYKRAYVWRNSNAICCDEDTTYIFTEYNDGQVVGRESYQSLLFSPYHNIGFRWKQFCLIHQIEPLWIWLGLLFIGLVIGFRKQILAYWRPALWGSAVTVFGVLAFFFLLCDFYAFSMEADMTTYTSDPFLDAATYGVIDVGFFVILTLLIVFGPKEIRKAGKVCCVMTAISAAMSILVSYRVIYLPRPWGETIFEPWREFGLFLKFGLEAIGLCAVSLALYLVAARIQKKSAVKKEGTHDGDNRILGKSSDE